MKKNLMVGLILLFCFIALVNSEITIPQIKDSLQEACRKYNIPKNIDYYVTEFRISKKNIKRFKINIDEHFNENSKRVSSSLVKKMIKNNSPAFESKNGSPNLYYRKSMIIEGGLIDENVLYYYIAHYHVTANFEKIKKEVIKYDVCYLYQDACRGINTPIKDFRGLISINRSNCNKGYPKGRGCVPVSYFHSGSVENCCCPEPHFEKFNQTEKELETSYDIISSYGLKMAMEELLTIIKNDLSLKEEDDI